jgi:phosphoglycolate phosphatase-like HAD superfamily hydrolase
VQPVAVFDIDGVLADVRHRLHYVESRPKRWSAFFAAAGADGLLAEGAALLRSLAETHEVRYLTGRPERLRAVTERWLTHHALPTEPLAMRPVRDRRPSRVFKRDRLRGWLAQEAVIELVVDDDPQVVQMVRDLGLPVLAADWQDVPKDEQQVLWEAQERLGRT